MKSSAHATINPVSQVIRDQDHKFIQNLGRLVRNPWNRIAVYGLVIGLIIRLAFILPADFPLHDGGLFFVMIRDLQANHFVLPLSTSYNHGLIPFAYPPLGLYLAGFTDLLTPLNLLDILRFLPLIFNILVAAAIYTLAQVLGFSREKSTVAMTAFLLLPEGFRWLIMGGGLTRSVGLLFAVLTIRQVLLLYLNPSIKNVILSILFASATVLSHLEMAWFALYTCVLFFIFFSRNRQGLLNSILVGLGVLFLTSPWWATVMARYGSASILMSITGSSSEWPWYDGLVKLIFNPTLETFFPVLACIGLSGAILASGKGNYLFLIWTLSVFTLQSRGPFAKATIPLSFLISIAVIDFIFPALTHIKNTSTLKKSFFTGLFGIALLFIVLSDTLGYRKLVAPLPSEERQAMIWISANTPASSRFLITPSDNWVVDVSPEWFPALSSRESILTAQGYEFSNGNAFSERIQNNRTVRECVLEGSVDCVERWSKDQQEPFDYIYIPKREAIIIEDPYTPSDCCDRFRASIENDPHFDRVFENNGAVIYKYITATSVSD